MKCSFVLAALCCSSLLLSMPVYGKKPDDKVLEAAKAVGIAE
ncbi:MAG: hypothetical protein ACOYMW_05690 [Candidatus Competibacteraceae bacterium]